MQQAPYPHHVANGPNGGFPPQTISVQTSAVSQPLQGASRSKHWTGKMTRTIAHYQRLEQIGEGAYGQVYKARCKDTGRHVALKKLIIQHAGYNGMTPSVIREIKILQRLRHPRLVEMIEVVSSKGVEHLDDHDEHRGDQKRKDSNDNSSKSDSRIIDAREGYKGNLFLVLEYVSHDLMALLDVRYQFTPIQIKCIFKQLLEALDYMHEQKYVHRDLKPANILIDSQHRVKLADFGLARCIEPPILDKLHDRGSSLELTNKVVTLMYRPIEILLGATRYGYNIDMWSAGCILAELVLGKTLLPGKQEMEQLNLIFDLLGTPTPDDGLQDLPLLRGGKVKIEKPKKSRLRDKYMNKMTLPCLNLLEKLLELDPTKRFNASRALESRYFKAEPRAPDAPEQLGSLKLGDGEGDFHEFHTKKKRKEAKSIANAAREEAKERGATEEEAESILREVYDEQMLMVQEQGISALKTRAEKEKDEEKLRRERIREEERNKPRRDDERRSEKEKKRQHGDDRVREEEDTKRRRRESDRGDSRRRDDGRKEDRRRSDDRAERRSSREGRDEKLGKSREGRRKRSESKLEEDTKTKESPLLEDGKPEGEENIVNAEKPTIENGEAAMKRDDEKRDRESKRERGRSERSKSGKKSRRDRDREDKKDRHRDRDKERDPDRERDRASRRRDARDSDRRRARGEMLEEPMPPADFYGDHRNGTMRPDDVYGNSMRNGPPQRDDHYGSGFRNGPPGRDDRHGDPSHGGPPLRGDPYGPPMDHRGGPPLDRRGPLGPPPNNFRDRRGGPPIGYPGQDRGPPPPDGHYGPAGVRNAPPPGFRGPRDGPPLRRDDRGPRDGPPRFDDRMDGVRRDDWGLPRRDDAPFRDDRGPRRDDGLHRDRAVSRREDGPHKDDRMPLRPNDGPHRDDRGPPRREDGPHRDDRVPFRRDDGPHRDERGLQRSENGPQRDDRGPPRRDDGPHWDDRGLPRRDDGPHRDDRGPPRQDGGSRRDDLGPGLPRREDGPHRDARGASHQQEGPRRDDRGPPHQGDESRRDDRAPTRRDDEPQKDERGRLSPHRNDRRRL